MATVATQGLECCWVCHRALRVPLFSLHPRQLACYKIHRKCFAEAVFEKLQTNILILIEGPRSEERWRLSCHNAQVGRPESEMGRA